MRVKPTTTGDTAKGRSMSAERSALPGNSRRTMTSAIVMPKIVFKGTAISAISRVSLSAATASRAVIASHTGPTPFENVCATIMPTGISSRPARERSAIDRRPNLTIMLRPPPSKRRDRHEHGQRDGEQHDRERRRAGDVVALNLRVDMHRRDLGLKRDIAGQH